MSELTGRLPGIFFKYSDEVVGVEEARPHSDLLHGQGGFLQQLSGVFNTRAAEIADGGYAEGGAVLPAQPVTADTEAVFKMLQCVGIFTVHFNGVVHGFQVSGQRRGMWLFFFCGRSEHFAVRCEDISQQKVKIQCLVAGKVFRKAGQAVQSQDGTDMQRRVNRNGIFRIDTEDRGITADKPAAQAAGNGGDVHKEPGVGRKGNEMPCRYGEGVFRRLNAERTLRTVKKQQKRHGRKGDFAGSEEAAFAARNRMQSTCRHGLIIFIIFLKENAGILLGILLLFCEYIFS